MDAYKAGFIDFMIESNVLTFGDFTLKSGRRSPYLSTPESTAQAHSSTASANTTPTALRPT